MNTLTIDNTVLSTLTTELPGTSNTLIFTEKVSPVLLTNTYKFLFQGNTTSNVYQCTEILLSCDGITTYMTEYATILSDDYKLFEIIDGSTRSEIKIYAKRIVSNQNLTLKTLRIKLSQWA